MTITELIKLAEDKYKELEHYGWGWRSFYNGFLCGAIAMMDSQWKSFPENKPLNPGVYLVIKKDKGHGVRVDRMRWYPFDSGIHPEVYKSTFGWGGNYGRSVKYWREFPTMPILTGEPK